MSIINAVKHLKIVIQHLQQLLLLQDQWRYTLEPSMTRLCTESRLD
jgi:hypothetical protein